MDCPFCCFLKNCIGQFIRIGVVCNCDTNDHIYRDGYITKKSFYNNAIRLYDSPTSGEVIFTACCDSIFEIYIFDTNTPTADAKPSDITDIATMEKQRRNLLESVQGNLQKEETANE
jgi:hypothetical protein